VLIAIHAPASAHQDVPLRLSSTGTVEGLWPGATAMQVKKNFSGNPLDGVRDMTVTRGSKTVVDPECISSQFRVTGKNDIHLSGSPAGRRDTPHDKAAYINVSFPQKIRDDVTLL
jgi:hypothetical protein